VPPQKADTPKEMGRYAEENEAASWRALYEQRLLPERRGRRLGACCFHSIFRPRKKWLSPKGASPNSDAYEQGGCREEGSRCWGGPREWIVRR
jgi:hypothetical protein